MTRALPLFDHAEGKTPAQHGWDTSTLTADLLAKLRSDRWLAVAEVQVCPRTLQRVDVLAVRRKLSSEPFLVLEVKTSRADLLGDLRREKWRGYLAVGAVAFAFPAGLALPQEIPPEAGILMRIAQGWSWRRSPRWREAPAPSDWLHRRMSLSAWDQGAALMEALARPRRADEFTVAANERRALGARLAKIAIDQGVAERMLADKRAEWERLNATADALRDSADELRSEVWRLRSERDRLLREEAA